MDNHLFNFAYGCYTVSVLLHLLYFITKQERFSRIAWSALGAALLLHGGSLLLRLMETRGHFASQALLLRQDGQIEAALLLERAAHLYVPWSNGFESFSLLGGMIAFLIFAIDRMIPIPVLGAFVTPVSWGLLTAAFFSERTPSPSASKLLHVWIAGHVPILALSYALFGVAFAVGIAYLLGEHQIKSKRPGELVYRLPSLDDMDHLIGKLLLTAFPLFTLGIFLGTLWAHAEWGRYWGWDPKETWALLTGCVYGGSLYLHYFAHWRGRKTAYLSIVGFLFVLFTYVGVNFLSPLHEFLSVKGS